MARDNTVLAERLDNVNGNTQFQSYEVSVPASTGAYEADISFPYIIRLIRGRFMNKAEFDGDWVEFIIGRNTIIGDLTIAAGIGDSVLNVSSTVTDSIARGHHATIGAESFRVLSVDATAGTITIDGTLTAVYSPEEDIKQTIKMIPHLYLEGTDAVVTLEGGAGNTEITAGTIMTVVYNNDTGTAKTFSIILEYLY